MLKKIANEYLKNAQDHAKSAKYRYMVNAQATEGERGYFKSYGKRFADRAKQYKKLIHKQLKAVKDHNERIYRAYEPYFNEINKASATFNPQFIPNYVRPATADMLATLAAKNAKTGEIDEKLKAHLMSQFKDKIGPWFHAKYYYDQAPDKTKVEYPSSVSPEFLKTFDPNVEPGIDWGEYEVDEDTKNLVKELTPTLTRAQDVYSNGVSKIASSYMPIDHKVAEKSVSNDVDARKMTILSKDIKDKAFKTPKIQDDLKNELKEAILLGGK